MARKKLSKKAGASKIAYTAADLIAKAEEFVESLDLEMAAKYYEKALQVEPMNTEAMDALAELLMEMGDEDTARKLFFQSISAQPTENFTKYMYLGQLLSGPEALQVYEKGISLLEQEKKKVVSGEHEGDMEWLQQQHCSALCSMAEVYLTDLCMEDDAEQRCEQYVNAALAVDPTSFEALQMLASVRLSQSRSAEADEALEKSLATWWRDPESDDDNDVEDLASDADSDDGAPAAAAAADDTMEGQQKTRPPLPPFAFRTTTVKLLLELNKPDIASAVAATLLAEDDEDIEVLYVSGLAANMCDDFDTARAHLDRAWELLKKTDCPPELRAQVGGLLEDVKRRLEARAAVVDSAPVADMAS